MAGNPLIAQGTLVRVRASVLWNDFPELNVTASFLGKEGIRVALEGSGTVYLPTMTGAVTSQEPYVMISMTMNLLKTQPLADAYKAQLESDSQLGSCTVRPDAAQLGVYQFINCAIQPPRDLNFSGEDAAYVVTVGGYYLINSSLFDAS
jgi:hypothetical protein